MRPYPDDRIGPFDPPPRTITDGENRTIRILAVGDTIDWEAAVELLVGMYEAFDPADRAQGIPPSGESSVRRWLDGILTPEAHHVLARHEERVVGHATLVPSDDGYELAIFVLRAYQGAGIGTELLTTLLGLGADGGVERVWLSVERWNHAAIALYEKVGFERSDTNSLELEMAAKLAVPE